MAETARARDMRFPNLDATVVEAWREAPPEVVVEVIDGELFTMPRPRPRHARGSSRLGARLRPFDDPDEGEPGGWIILDEPELHLGALPDIVVPDLAGWHRERLDEDVFNDDDETAISVAPDWVCEVTSPRTRRIDRGRKMRLWRREGVGHVWVMDPSVESLEVFRLGPDGFILVDTWEGNVVVRAEPFAAIELPLRSLWRR